MWEPYRLSLAQWAPGCCLVYDRFHILQHAHAAIDEVRRAEFFRQGGRMRGPVKGKRWLLLSRWVNLNTEKKRQLESPEDLFLSAALAQGFKVFRVWRESHAASFWLSRQFTAGKIIQRLTQ
jgi:transposase